MVGVLLAVGSIWSSMRGRGPVKTNSRLFLFMYVFNKKQLYRNLNNLSGIHFERVIQILDSVMLVGGELTGGQLVIVDWQSNPQKVGTKIQSKRKRVELHRYECLVV